MRTIIFGLLSAVMIMASTMAYAQTVYATKNGKRYHQAECALINKKSPVAVTMEEAVARGLTPCSKCFKQEQSKDK